MERDDDAVARAAFAELRRAGWTLEEIATAFEVPAFVQDAERELEREAAE